MPQIRKMKADDLESVASIAAAVFAAPWSKQGFAEALPMENACFLVAQEGEEILGYCGLFLAADEGEILNVAVSPAFQGRGVADRMLTALLVEGERSGVHRFFLEVRVSNVAAIRLYQKHGFSIQGIRKNFYAESQEDAYVMNRIDAGTE